MATASSSVSRAWDSILGSDSLDSPPAASPSDSRSPSASAPSAASDAASLLERLCPWTSVEFGYPGSLNYRSLLLDFHGQLVSPWHHVPLHAKNGALHFVCKTPQDCWVKYEAAPDEDYTPIRVHRAPAPAAAAASASGVSSPSPSPSHLQPPSHVQQGPPSRDGEESRREDLGLPRQEGVLKERAAVDWTRLRPQHYAENSMFNVGFLPQTYADPEQPAGADAAGGIFGGGGGGGSGGVWEGLVNDGRPIEAIEIGGKRMRTGEVCSVRPLAVFAVAGPARAEMSAEGGAGGGGSVVGRGAGEGETERDSGAEGRAEGRRTLSWVVVVVSTEDALASVIQEGATGIPSVLLPVLEQIVEWVRFAPCVNHDDDEAEFPLGEEPGGMQAAMVVVAQAHCAWQLLADDCPPPPPWVPADRVLSASALHQIWQSRGYLPPVPPRVASSASAARAASPAPFPTSSSAPLGPGPPPSPYTSASASASASRPTPLPPNLSMPSLHLTASSSCSSPSASPLHTSNPPADSAYALPPVSPSFPSPPPFSASSPSASPPPALPPFGAIPMSDQRVGSSARRNEAWARASIDSLAFSSLSLSIDSSFLSSGFSSGGAGSSSAGHSSNGSIGGNSSCDGDVGGAGAGAGGGGGARGRVEEGLGRGMFRGGLGGSGGAGGKRCGLPRPASSDNLKRFSSAPAERERGEGKQREWRRAQRAGGGAGKRIEGSSLGSQGEGKKQHSRVTAAGTAAAAAEAEGLSDEGRADADAEGEGEGVGSGEFQFDVVQIPGCGFHLLRHAAGGMGAGELGAPMDGGGGAAIGGSFRGSGRERKAHKGGGGSSSSSSGSSFSRGGLGSMSARSSSSNRHGGGGGAGSSSGRKAYWAGDLLKGSIPVRAGFGSARRAPSGYGPRGEAGSGEGGGAAAGGGGEGEGVSSVHLLSASHRGGAFSSPERSSSVAVAAAAAAGAGAAAAAATARSGSAPPSRLETFFSLRGSSLQSQSQLQQQQPQQQSALLLPRGAPSLERLFGHRKGKGSSHSGRGELGGGATEAYADNYEASAAAAAAGGELFGRGLSLSRAEREVRVEREEREETGEDGAGVFNRQLSLDQLYLRRKKRAERRLRGANSSASDAPPLSPPASSALGWVLGGGKFSSSGGSSSGYEGGRRRGEESVGGAQHGNSSDDATLVAFRLSPSLVSSHPGGATASESMACSEGSAAHETAPAMGGLARSIGSGSGGGGGGSSTGLQGRWCDLIEEYGGSGARSSASPTEPARPPLPRPLPPRAPSLTKQGLGGRPGEKGGEGAEREDRGADGEEAVVEGADEGQEDGGDLGLDCSASNGNGAGSSSSCVVSWEEHERQAEESGVAPSAASPSAAASTAVCASSAEASEAAAAAAMAAAAGMRSPSRVGKRQVSFHSVVKVIEFVQAREGEDSSSGSE
ncbi:unnamed protein product [Closterium sp. NIES-64]|nr:unnamed protein product [Closterium sp. NIES-64]